MKLFKPEINHKEEQFDKPVRKEYQPQCPAAINKNKALNLCKSSIFLQIVQAADRSRSLLSQHCFWKVEQRKICSGIIYKWDGSADADTGLSKMKTNTEFKVTQHEYE